MVLHILSSIDSVQIEKYTGNHSWVTASWCVGELSSCRPWQGPLFVCACLCECCLCVAMFVNVKLSTLLCCSETVWGVGIQRVAWSTCDDFWPSRAHGIISVPCCVSSYFSVLYACMNIITNTLRISDIIFWVFHCYFSYQSGSVYHCLEALLFLRLPFKSVSVLQKGLHYKSTTCKGSREKIAISLPHVFNHSSLVADTTNHW